MYCINSSGRPLVSYSTVVCIFFDLILFYLSYISTPLSPYHGNPPFIKYIIMRPTLSKSSLLLYSIPLWAFKLAYLGVPVNCKCSLYGICTLVLASLYLLASPKSIMWTICWSLLRKPMRKLSGLISLWMKLFLCKNSNLSIIWIPTITAVLMVNFLLQYVKRFSRLCPNKSMTKQL